MRIRVDHIVPYIGDSASGPAWSVPAVCSALAANGAHVRLHVLGPLPARDFDFEVQTYPRHSFPHKRLGKSPEMRRGLRKAAASAHILHNHSLWMLPNIYPAAATRNTSCRLVVSPRGTLSPWALNCSPWLKRLAMAMGQRRVLERADCLHATAGSEYEDIRCLGLRAPVAIIPNGIEVPSCHFLCKPVARVQRRLLFLGRIHPVKGIESLLRTWRFLEQAFRDWELRIVGPNVGEYATEMQKLCDVLGCRRVTFPGSVYGETKSLEYLNADLLVLPTHSENFGMAVAESLAHGVPVVVTKGAPWEGLEAEQCGWWIDIGEDPLAESLRDAMSRTPKQLEAMGQRGRAWMIRDFSWHEIGLKMLKTYEWLLGGGIPPEWIRMD